jgi:uncharacterized protein YdaU (DUF1376 family)
MMHYYKFNISAFYLSAGHLTAEESGIYRMLLDYYYETESPITEKALPVIRKRGLKGKESIVMEILNEFFTFDGEFWRHDKCDAEIAEYTAKADTARANGKRGGRPKKEEETKSVNDRNPEITGSKANYKLLTTNQELLTKNQELINISEFWIIYEKRVNKKGCDPIWKKLKVDKELFNKMKVHIAAQYRSTERKYWPKPKDYLKGERWNDDIIDYSDSKPVSGFEGNSWERAGENNFQGNTFDGELN